MPSLREVINFGEGNSYRLIRWNGNVSRIKIITGPSKTLEIPAHGAHWHYHSAMELTLMRQGRSTCFVADQIKRFEAGELLVLGPNVPHYWHHPAGTAGISIQWDFPLDHGIWDFGESKVLQSLTELALRGLHIRGKSVELADHRMEKMAGLGGLERLAGFLKLLHGLATASKTDVNLLSERPFDMTGSDQHEEAIRRAISYIRANYREPISLTELQALTGMGRAGFTRQFNRYAGKSFSVFLNQVRLEAVCNELRTTAKAISNIAWDHGFTQLSFFNRLFLRELKTTPSAYREANKQ